MPFQEGSNNNNNNHNHNHNHDHHNKKQKKHKKQKKIKQNNNQVPEALQENSWIPDAKKAEISSGQMKKMRLPRKTKMKPYLVGGFNPSEKY